MKTCPYCKANIEGWDELGGEDEISGWTWVWFVIAVAAGILGLLGFIPACANVRSLPSLPIPTFDGGKAPTLGPPPERVCHTWYIRGTNDRQCWRTNYEGDIGYPVACDKRCP